MATPPQEDLYFDVDSLAEDEYLTLRQNEPLVPIPPGDDEASRRRRVEIAAAKDKTSPTRRLKLELNLAQAASVTQPLESQLQILAGPGTGKTKTLISRVVYLLSLGVHPSNIIVTTFTVRAAAEMRTRLAELVGHSVANRLVLGTFHSIARQYLQRYGKAIGLDPKFQIADETDAKHFLGDVIKERDRIQRQALADAGASKEEIYKLVPLAVNATTEKRELVSIRTAISNLKARHILPGDPRVEEYLHLTNDQLIYQDYQNKLDSLGVLDFDDLLIKCGDLIKAQPNVVSNVQAVLVDEFQDTNVVQYKLMKLFANERSNITIVGDPDQSIYAFRAAESSNLKQMMVDFPNTTVISLEENYRSSGAIIKAALAVIMQDKLRIQKSVLANNHDGALPTLMQLSDWEVEAAFIVREIQRLMVHSAGVLRPKDFAILVRTARLTQPIEASLTAAGIDYRIVGGFRFWEREEIKLFLNYFTVIQSRKSPALLQIINTPKRGVGPAAQAALLTYANAYQVSLWDAINAAIDGKIKVSSVVRTALSDFVSVIEEAEDVMKVGKLGLPLAETLDCLIRRLDYKAVLKKKHEETWTSRWENLEELMAVLNKYKDPAAPDDNALPDLGDVGIEVEPDDLMSKFLATVNLAPMDEESRSADPSSVLTISTIHGSKGLEWPVVFIPGCFEGSVPHMLSLATEDVAELNEERRLLYVAMTRAKGYLYLTYPHLTTSMNVGQSPVAKISQFLTPAATRKCFQQNLPQFTYRSLQELSTIIGNECPTLDAFDEARRVWCAHPIAFSMRVRQCRGVTDANLLCSANGAAADNEYWANVEASARRRRGCRERCKGEEGGAGKCSDETWTAYREHAYDEYESFDYVNHEYYRRRGSSTPAAFASRGSSFGSAGDEYAPRKRQRTVSGGSTGSGATTIAALTAQSNVRVASENADTGATGSMFASSFVTGSAALLRQYEIAVARSASASSSSTSAASASAAASRQPPRGRQRQREQWTMSFEIMSGDTDMSVRQIADEEFDHAFEDAVRVLKDDEAGIYWNRGKKSKKAVMREEGVQEPLLPKPTPAEVVREGCEVKTRAASAPALTTRKKLAKPAQSTTLLRFLQPKTSSATNASPCEDTSTDGDVHGGGRRRGGAVSTSVPPLTSAATKKKVAVSSVARSVGIIRENGSAFVLLSSSSP
ncbi:P-loop containing nucleoside triphosphate hydrolase protein [Limtongia smithiae]|uniref:P-loop containing nucleoside triphosphate hydrolase protein n=1 Tax=Limtongia smithiae TaxID=1125753 RepID=UPI0034D0031A